MAVGNKEGLVRRKIRVTTTGERMVDDKFLMIYMELGPKETRKTAKVLRKTIWHLEDEKYPQFAMCGLILHDHCVSVSPALAMLGSPCPDCAAIVRLSIEGNMRNTFMLQKSDLAWRNKIHDYIPQYMFEVRVPKGEKKFE